MKIFITGATGFIGRSLTKSLLADGYEVTVLSRNSQKATSIFGSKVKIVEGDPGIAGSWTDEVGASDAVINLCGAPILKKKWTDARKQLLLDSRIVPTGLIIEAISKAKNKPEVLISGSAVGYYSDRGDELITEESGPGSDFGAHLCSSWEAEANKATEFGVRVVTLRTGIVLGPDGGALSQMTPPFKFFVGGPIGNGRQYMSWVHLDDHIGITKLALADTSITGPVNMTAPEPVINREFMKAIGKAMHRPSWLPVPGFVLQILFGEGAALLLEGQRAIPKKAQASGYQFINANLDAALADVLA